MLITQGFGHGHIAFTKDLFFMKRKVVKSFDTKTEKKSFRKKLSKHYFKITRVYDEN